MKYTNIAIIALPVIICSCALEPPAAQKMTFVQAMIDLSEGMEALRASAPPPGEKRLGLVPTQMTATFALTSVASGTAGVDLGVDPGSPITKLGVTTSNSQNLTRANTVTVTFMNVFVDKDGKPRTTTGSPDSDGVIPGFVVPFRNTSNR